VNMITERREGMSGSPTKEIHDKSLAVGTPHLFQFSFLTKQAVELK
jgi:hypothetical protein